jgi:hypothetical protein
MKDSFKTLFISGVVGAVALAGGAALAQPLGKPLPTSEQPVKPEKNPQGDIPDNQVFITYHSPLGFSIKVPEGWARRDAGDGATFNDKYNTVVLSFQARVEPLRVAGVKGSEVPALEKMGKAIRVSAVKELKLPSGRAIAVSYGSNSEPNPVTNKAIRLENERYFFWRDGKLVTLTLSAPYGADNTDQWTLMAKSFRWR